MDSHVKRILHGDVRFPPCKLIYMVEKRISPARPGFTWGCVSHQLDLGLHGEGDCLDGGGHCLHGESVSHHLDLGLHGEGDCLDEGGQNLGILMNPRNPNESWES